MKKNPNFAGVMGPGLMAGGSVPQQIQRTFETINLLLIMTVSLFRLLHISA